MNFFLYLCVMKYRKIKPIEVLDRYRKRWDSRKKVNLKLVKLVISSLNDILHEVMLSGKNFNLPKIGKFKLKIRQHGKVRVAARKTNGSRKLLSEKQNR